MTLDDIRARYPNLAGAVYFYEPGCPVTLEMISPEGESFSFTAPTVAECVAKAFPEIEVPDWKFAFAAQSRKLQHVLHIPGVKEALAELEHPEPTEPEPEEPAASVFD